MTKTIPQIDRILPSQYKVTWVKHSCISNFAATRVAFHICYPFGSLSWNKLSDMASRKPPGSICWKPKAKSLDEDDQ
ncbi:hypothetical protein O6P43_003424 [Quillaja saponaria]|uniref:Uncharacterized protein n=1 Tax=Quillaja saponaria TaxID=32244 RepID=A0AAD7VLR6_QUISA|nr:hypothetical protein O6P43_003424 [Quillaja saponaria]